MHSENELAVCGCVWIASTRPFPGVGSTVPTSSRACLSLQVREARARVLPRFAKQLLWLEVAELRVVQEAIRKTIPSTALLQHSLRNKREVAVGEFASRNLMRRLLLPNVIGAEMRLKIGRVARNDPVVVVWIKLRLAESILAAR
jgi:hypothetical protein